MFDKITIQAKCSDDECVRWAHAHALRPLLDSTGIVIEYRSSPASKFTGIEILIKTGSKSSKITIKTSLHKYWNNLTRGVLKNDDDFTMSEAKSAFESLLFEFGLIPERVRIILFEIGVNLNVKYDVLTFIERALYINNNDKWMFQDANYVKNRQKTSMKYDDIRKYYKIYDKTFEMMKKRRGKARLLPPDTRHVLRIETVYRRHNESAVTFFSDDNMKRLSNRFFSDWRNLFFVKKVVAQKGSKKSEIERAEKIANEGRDIYLEGMKKEFDDGRMTAKQYRTVREFVRDFDANSHRFNIITSEQEREYMLLLKEKFEMMRS